jgi:MFS family permease
VFHARRGLAAIIAVRFLATATFLGVDSFIPLAADRLHGARPIVQGFVIAGAALAWTGGQALAARRGSRLSVRRATSIGFGLMLVGVVAAAPVLWPDWPLWLTFIGWSIGGLGIGILFNPTTVGAMSYSVDGREGEIGSQIHLADSLGFGIMSVVGGAIVALSDRTSMTLQTAIGINFCLAAFCACAGLVASRGARAAPVTLSAPSLRH